MQITRITNNDYKPNCKGISRVVYKPNVTPIAFEKIAVKHKNTSWMYRPKISVCMRTYNYFSHAFNGVDKVNVYNYGCSLGYEAYSYIIWLLSGKKKNPDKFLPIIAKDYDEDIIKAAKNFQLLLDEDEMSKIKMVAGKKKYRDFLEPGMYSKYLILGENHRGMLTNLTEKLTDNVQFSVADIRKDYKNIEPEKSIVMASNFWPYMEKEDRYELAENLYKQLDKGSCVKIDEFDNSINWLDDKITTTQLLVKVGFKRTAINDFVLKK